MADAVTTMSGILPTIVLAGVATKMAGGIRGPQRRKRKR